MYGVNREGKGQGRGHGAVRQPITRARPRTPTAYRAIGWLLLFALPVHGLAVVYLAFWGPLHFHLDDDDHHHPRAHAHGPGQIERHHHSTADATVMTVDAPALAAHAVEDGTLQAWSGAVFPAMVSAALSPALDRTTSGIDPASDSPVKTRFLGRPERPPRHHRA